MKKKTISAEEFDRLFDEGHDISEYLDHSSARRPGLDPMAVGFDLPQWMVYWLYNEAESRGTTKEALMKAFIEERIEQEKAKTAGSREGKD